MIYYVNHLVKELQSIHENRLELANKLQLAMNSNTVSIHIYHIAYSLYYIFICMCILTCIYYFIHTISTYLIILYMHISKYILILINILSYM